jgi:hypothetical protein
MRHILTADFLPGESVELVQTGFPGVIDAVMFRHETLEYRVVFWAADKRVVEWVYTGEIRRPQERGPVGFATA